MSTFELCTTVNSLLQNEKKTLMHPMCFGYFLFLSIRLHLKHQTNVCIKVFFNINKMHRKTVEARKLHISTTTQELHNQTQIELNNGTLTEIDYIGIDLLQYLSDKESVYQIKTCHYPSNR